MAKTKHDARRRAAQKRKQRELKKRDGKAARHARQQGQGTRRRLKDAGGFPVVDCVISKGWRERGLAHVLLARDAGDGTWAVGGFYLDVLCLGLKDTAAIPSVSPDEYESNIKHNIFNDPVEFEPADPGEVRYLIEESIRYAESLGFHPNRRWEESRQLLRGLEPKETAVEFGRDGLPCLVLRPGENLQGARNKLQRRLPEGGYRIVDETEAAG